MCSPRPYARLFAAASLVISLAASPARADFEFASADLFAVNYATATAQSLTITISDASAFSLSWIPGGVCGRWTVSVLGTKARVFMTLEPVDATTSRWRIAVLHDGPLPAGWFVESLEQRFDFRQMRAGVAGNDVFRIAKVYGPTAYRAGDGHDVTAPYPNFLQVQQLTLTNRSDDVALSVLAADFEGHRKCMGFKSSTTSDVRRLYVRHRPENLGAATTFLPRYPVLVNGRIAGGMDGAIRWYRSVQSQDAGSFLSRRRAASTHPFLAGNKFVLAVGATLSQASIGDRYDVTDAYARDTLDAFGGIHGANMLVYHLGWENDLYDRRALWPDISESILPGYQRLLNSARSRGHRNVPYFLPAFVNQRSSYYSVGDCRTDRLGAPIMTRAVPGAPDLFGWMSWHSSGPSRIYDRVVLSTMIEALGFDGAYMDALSASGFSYNAQHDHPVGQNEQLVGINRWFTAARARLARSNRVAMFSNETPTEVLPTDMSGLDLSAPGGSGLNLFRRTYTGREWPTTNVVLAYHALLYNFGLARCLREGTRPTILWPEWDGVFPADLRTAPAYGSFRSLLTQYASRYGRGFGDAIDGFLMAELESFQATPIPPIAALAGYPSRWKAAVPAVLHGVFAPDADVEERVIVLARWTSPDSALIGGLALPATHPLRNQVESANFRLSKSALRLDPNREYDVTIYDASQNAQRIVGRLPSSPTSELSIATTLAPASFQIVRVVPVT